MSKKIIDLDKIRKESPVLEALINDLEKVNINKGQAVMLLKFVDIIDKRKTNLKFRKLDIKEKEIILRELLEIKKAIRNIAKVKHIELN